MTAGRASTKKVEDSGKNGNGWRAWIPALVVLVGAVLAFGSVQSAASGNSKKNDVQDLKIDANTKRSIENAQDNKNNTDRFKRIEDKLDRLLERVK